MLGDGASRVLPTIERENDTCLKGTTNHGRVCLSTCWASRKQRLRRQNRGVKRRISSQREPYRARRSSLYSPSPSRFEDRANEKGVAWQKERVWKGGSSLRMKEEKDPTEARKSMSAP